MIFLKNINTYILKYTNIESVFFFTKNTIYVYKNAYKISKTKCIYKTP